MSEREPCEEGHVYGFARECVECGADLTTQTPTKEPPMEHEDYLAARAAERAQERGYAEEAMYPNGIPARAEEGGEGRAEAQDATLAAYETGYANGAEVARAEYDRKVKRLMADQGAEHNRQEAEIEHLRSVVADQGRQAVLRQGQLEDQLSEAEAERDKARALITGYEQAAKEAESRGWHQGYDEAQEQLHEEINALDRLKMDAESQRDAAVLRQGALEEALEGLVESVLECSPIDFQGNPNGPDEWMCKLCYERMNAKYDPPGKLNPPPSPFPHDATCTAVLAVAARAVLAARAPRTP